MATKKRILIACEYSGVTRNSFRNLGFNAVSCDLIASEDNSADHIIGDVTELLNQDWDLLIAHPPCTYLSNSGVKHLHIDKTRWKKMEDAARFFKLFIDATHIKKRCIENPVMHGYAKKIIGENQSQIIHPWQFGHPEQKQTCLWLFGLPKLAETHNVKKQMLLLPKNKRERLHYLPPSPDRWKERSRTYTGIGQALAEQYGRLL